MRKKITRSALSSSSDSSGLSGLSASVHELAVPSIPDNILDNA